MDLKIKVASAVALCGVLLGGLFVVNTVHVPGGAAARRGEAKSRRRRSDPQGTANVVFRQILQGRKYVALIRATSRPPSRRIVPALIPLTVLALLAFWLARPAHAAGILDNLQANVQATTAPWMNNSLAIGQTLFGIVMTVTIVMALCRYAATNGTLEGVGHSMMSLLLNIIPVFVVMTAMTAFLPNIVAVANQLAGQITGVQITGPSEIFGLGVAMCVQILKSASAPLVPGAAMAHTVLSGPSAIFLSGVTLAMGVVTCIVVIGAFTIIAAEYLLCFLQAYIRLSIEAWNLGWSASQGTRGHSEAFLGEAKHALTRVILTIGIVAFIVAMTPQMASLATSTDFSTVVVDWLKLGGGAVLAAILAIKVPHLAHSGGQPSLSAIKVGNEAYAAASSGVSRIRKAIAG